METRNYPVHIVAAGGFVVNAAGKVLMLKSPRYGDWEFPGGQVEEGETIPHALEREIFEETGIVARVISLEPVCKIRKEENRSNGDHSREIAGSFFIARGNSTELFETINETLNDVSFAIERFVKGTSSTLITTTGNRTTNMLLMKIRTKSLASVAFIGYQAPWTQAQLT